MAKSATPGSLIDGGANICITGDLTSLFDVVAIPPLSISVAVEGDSSIDDCCTAHGMTPLQLDDGSIYWQVCYYCKNATETIISPEAIIAASDTLVHWTQEGHRGDAPGSIRFSSDSGLYSITLHLEKRDGLYYCPTDVFTVDKDPVHQHIPVIRRLATPTTPPAQPRRSKRYIPVTRDSMTDSEVWMLLELYTAVVPAVFSVSVFCRYQIYWIFGISVGITRCVGKKSS